jgi:hypothetical protein
MRIIDAHIHTDFSFLPPRRFAGRHGIDFSWKGLQHELDTNAITAAIAITTDWNAPTPGQSRLLLAQAKKDFRIKPVCNIHPAHTGFKARKEVESLLKHKAIFGIKIFPGYGHLHPTDTRYFPFYRLAAKYHAPVIIHTGDTFGSQHLVKYAHPLGVDELAVAFAQTKFVIAHLGNPWVRSASEIVYKNENGYADLSAFCIGRNGRTPDYVINDIKYALEYTERPDKFLYGSDWPLARMDEYIAHMKKAIPREHWKAIFFDNARTLFGIE